MSQQKGRSMKRWVQEWARGLKQWSLWLLGDAPLPGKRSRAVLAGTMAVVAVLAVGTVVGSQLPALNGAGSANGSNQTDVLNQADASTNGSGSVPAPDPTAGSGTQSSGNPSTTVATGRTHAQKA